MRFAAFGLLVCLQTMTACSSHAAMTPPPAPPAAPPQAVAPPQVIVDNDCDLIAEPGDPVAYVGVTERVDPAHAPRPSNDGERLVFRQRYETLIRLDCKGRLRPALASSWRLDADGRSWLVTLRDNAQFTDGTIVTADDVRASWSSVSGGLRPDAAPLVQAIGVVDDRTVRITLTPSSADAPTALAHPDLGIAKPATDGAWPLGTRGVPPVRTFYAADARDVLDAGVDLVLTRDPSALEYARTLAQFQIAPMPWQRTHVLATPRPSVVSSLQSDQARQTLAHDAVRGEARGAQGPFWWDATNGCDSSPPSQAARALTPRIVYDASDAAGRDLSERLVGLGMYPRATGLAGTALTQALRAGADAGYVISVDSRPIDPCRDLHLLMGTMPWLDPGSIVPLIDTRLQAIVRRGRSAGSIEWDGGLLLTVPQRQ